MRRLVTLLSILCLFLIGYPTVIHAQSGILNPADPIVTYDPAAPPATPANGIMAKWVRTKRVGFNTDSYKAYFYKNLAFRLKFPKSYQHGVSDGKAYPVFIFFHGIGERGSIYDNDYQLYHGGEHFRNAVDNGAFDGFLLYAQSATTSGEWSGWQFDVIKEIVENYLVPQVKADINRVIVDGLSGGGSATWQITRNYPQFIAASLPISAPVNVPTTNGAIPNLKYTPIWTFQGGLDDGPTPFTTESVVNAYKNAGANMTYSLYPNEGHGCWYTAWNESNFMPFISKAHKANPWPLNGRFEYCPGETINQVIGVTPGFSGYEWRKDGVLIAGATGNEITATSLGVYSCRIRRGSTWSEWSPIPVEIKIKAATVPPAISITGMMSRAIPSLDGSTNVPLEVPAGYATYSWQRVGNPTVLGTARTYAATSAGNYTVRVTEQFGCSSDFSTAVSVIDANGANKPEPATGFTATTTSKTSIRLDWIDNPAPANNETNYEIYQARSAAGPYKLIGLTGANAITYSDNGLDANTTYYYKVRSINTFAASAGTGPVSALTQKDEQAPSVPANLRVTGTTKTSVALAWNASTDDVGVTRYEVYVNGVMSYTTTQSTFTVYNLIYNQTYNFVVKAKDLAGNTSGASNQATGQPTMNGLNYKYYTFTGQWNNLPDFNTIEPVATGNMPNIALVPRTQDDNFAFIWEGYITIPVDGTYTFRTNSDDGSRLWLGARNGTSTPYTFAGAPTVNNDGLHGGQDRNSADLVLTAGVYPIAMAFYEQGGGEQMIVSWRTPQTGGNFVAIPNGAYQDIPVVNGLPPAMPTDLAVTALSYKTIGLTWTDNSNNETGFEIWRALSPSATFGLVGRAAANANSYTDTALAPGTTYYYKMKAVGHYGESAFNVQGNGVDYAYYEMGVSSLPDFTGLVPTKTGRTPNFVLGEQNRGDNFIFKYSGKIYIPVAGSYNFFTTSDDGSNLYIDGFDNAHKVVANDYLQGPTERGGSINLSVGYHDIYVTFFEAGGGEVLEARYEGPAGSGINKQVIPTNVLGDAVPNATTLPLPAGPLAPSLLTATGASASTIEVTWQDNSPNELGFEVFRSIGTNENFSLYKSLGANAASFTDSLLGANGIYYYKVRAINDGGISSYSNEDSAITVNSAPEVAAISNQSMRFGTNLNVNASASDADGGSVTISLSGLPAFGSFVQTPGQNGGVITFNNPTAGDQATYPITVTASDAFGGSSFTTFDLLVTDNYSPVAAAVSNVTMSENQNTQVNLSATDQNAADVLTWTFTGLPSFATVTTGTGTAQITLAPGYADNGVYNVTAKVDDGRSAFDTKSFTITVNDVNPNYKVYINFTSSTYQAPAPWNNTNKTPAPGDLFSNLKNDAGATTAISLQLMNAWQGLNTNGANTGNNSGIYPDNVLRTSYYTNTVVQNLKVAGLSPTGKYTFTFLGSRYNPSGSVMTVYAIGGQSVTLNPANNIQNTVSINAVTPAADGTITFTVAKAPGATFGYINSVVIESVFDDGSAPAKPRDLTGSFLDGKAHLAWTDAAFNETAYQVYRSSTLNGTYTLLNPGGNNANLTSYDDATVTGNKTFYYTVRAVNGNGNSPYSDTVAVVTPNTSPIITAISNVSMNTGETENINVTSTDDIGDVITLSLSNAPAFASLTDNGNGTGTITIQPGTTAGVFNNITLTATDEDGASSSRTFNLTVTDASLTYTYVNFNQTYPVTGWNNFNSAPNAGVAINNLKDKNGASTNMNISLTDTWAGTSTGGTLTGNNSGVYPDDVLRTTYFDANAGGRRILLSGLASNKKYNLVFSASRASAGTLTTRYAAGGKSADLNVDNNTTGSVTLSDLSPNANGQIEITVSKVGSSSNFYIGALEVQSYPFLAVALPPVNVNATGLSVDRIKIDWTNAGSAGTGYELWRSSSYNGTYTKIADIALSAVTYTNTGLTGGTAYYYKIRTVISAGQYTDFSNIASASTVSYIVNINLNDAAANAQSGGWNNTNTLLSPTFVLPNLINSLDQNTGINFNIVENFSGFNNALGLTTGNNSGAVPDKVMSNFYFLDFADTARFKFNGLNQASAYNVIFYAGSSYNQANNTVYKIGNQTVSQNSYNNYNNTVKINNITPDANGEIFVTVYSTVGYGFLNAVMLEAIPNVTPEDEPLITSTGRSTNAPATAAATAAPSVTTQAAKAAVQTVEIEDATLIKAFPNPFANDLTLQLSLKEDVAKFTVVLYDFSGKTVYRREFNNAAKGVWKQQLDLSGRLATRGTYVLQVIGVDQKPRATKVVKY